MARLDDPLTIRKTTLKNRIVMAPMHCFSFEIDNGYHTQQYVDHYIARARGGAGLIETAATSVQPQTRQPGIWEDGQIPQLRQIVAGCHAWGAPVIVQIFYSPPGDAAPATDEIRGIQQLYVDAARRIQAAGADGLEIHCCHGSFLCRLASGETNGRDDRYGGALENRARLLTEMLPWIRDAVGDEMIVAARLGGNMPSLEDGLGLARLVEAAGVDFLSISHGNTAPTPAPAGYEGSAISYLAARVKAQASVPVMGVGDVRTRADADYLMAAAGLDLVAVGRGMLADANWARGALYGEDFAECLDCPRCAWFSDHTCCPAKRET